MPLYVQRSDNIKLATFCSTAARLYCVIRYRSHDKGKPEVDIFEHTPNTNRAEATTYRDCPVEGWLESISTYPILAAGAVRRGQCFGSIGLQRQRYEKGTTLTQGYISLADNLFWADGHGKGDDSVDKPGIIRSILGTNPAAGNEIAEAVPTNARWRIIAMMYTLVTDATVANRTTSVSITDGTNEIYNFTGPGAQIASQTKLYQASTQEAHRGSDSLYIFGHHNLPLWPDLLQGYTIGTRTNNLQAGDDYSAPRLWVMEWIED